MLPLALILASIPIPGKPRPTYVEFDFGQVPLKAEEWMHIDLEVISAGGDAYKLGQSHRFVSAREDITEDIVAALAKEGFKVELLAEATKVRVYGRVDKQGKVICPAVRGEIWTRNLSPAERPKVKNPPPPPVEFDLRTLPLAPGHDVSLSFGVVPDDRTGGPAHVAISYKNTANRADLAKDVAQRFAKAGLVAGSTGEVVWVRGWVGKDGDIRPAVGGAVESKELKKEELPKITGLPRPAPCVEFDFGPIAKAAAGRRTAKLAFEVGPFEEGKPYRYERVFDLLSPPGDVATVLETSMVVAGFKVERDGVCVRVLGWSDPKMRFHPASTGKVESADLKQSELPKVTLPEKSEGPGPK